MTEEYMWYVPFSSRRTEPPHDAVFPPMCGEWNPAVRSAGLRTSMSHWGPYHAASHWHTPSMHCPFSEQFAYDWHCAATTEAQHTAASNMLRIMI
ncbi:hypothetical protein DIPPA_16844 [Diplonema papillatum]|nr:hypothetical protein DIPPA_16844 [Diplonema papillatum]